MDLVGSGNFVGHHLGLYKDGYKLTRLAHDLVGKHSFATFRAKALYALSMSELWVRPISHSLETARKAFVAGSDSGDVLARRRQCKRSGVDQICAGRSP